MDNTTAAGRVPPFNLEAERSVLGACLLEKEALSSVVEGLHPQDFYDPRHRTAFELMSEMYQKGIPVDSLSFRDELSKRKLEEKTGGLPFIAALLDAVTTTANVEYHIGIVQDKSVHRSLIRVGSEITKLGFSEDKEVDVILETAEQKVFKIARTGGKTATIRDSKQLVKLAVDDIEKRLVSGLSMTGVPTGFKDFDKMSGGLQAGSLYILAARPSMGKTAWAINVAQHIALQENIPALIFSLEMSGEQIVQRMLSSVSRVNLRQLFHTKNIQNEQWNNLTDAANKLSYAPIFIDDSSTLKTSDLRSRCRRFFAEQKTDKGLIVLDYLQLMDSSKTGENRQQEVSHISRALKSIAREFEVPVLALSQLSRDVEKRGGSKKPQLSDLRDSGAIEQDADMVIFLYRDAYYAQEDTQDSSAEVIIAKNRSGPTGKVNLVFFREYARFEDSIVGGYSE